MADDAEAKFEAELKAEAAAAKAYAAATEAPVAKAVEPVPVDAVVAEPIKVEPVIAEAAKVDAVAEIVAAPAVIEPKVAAPKAATAPKSAKAIKIKTAKLIKAPAVPAAAKPAATPAKAVAKAPKPKPVAVKKPTAKVPVKAVPKPAPAKIAPALKLPSFPKLASNTPAAKIKEAIMTKTTTTAETVVTKIKGALSEVGDKAKAAFEKSTASLGEAGAFAKGNVEAIVESGKLFSTGAQELGKGYVEEAKVGFETLTADVKELAAVKSPTDFFKLQGEIVRRNMDAAIAQSSKNTEAMMKLATEAFAPLSSRINLAVEKINKVA